MLRSVNINENWIKARTFSVPKLKFLRLIGHIILRSMDGPCGISRYHITKHAHPIQILKAFELNRYINNMFKRAERKKTQDFTLMFFLRRNARILWPSTNNCIHLENLIIQKEIFDVMIVYNSFNLIHFWYQIWKLKEDIIPIFILNRLYRYYISCQNYVSW